MTNISYFVQQTIAQDTPEQMFALFMAAVAEYGYDRMVVFASASAMVQRKHTGPYIGPGLAILCPDTWLSHYVENGYIEIDPILLRVPISRLAFLWSEVAADTSISSQQRKIFDESLDAGLMNGVAIPLHGPAGETYVVSLASGNHEVRPCLRQLQVIATAFYLAYSGMFPETRSLWSRPNLSNRELECLSWSARGKSAWAISMILDISESTVVFYLKNAMHKLGANNRVQAVALAARCGLIAL